jgi:uncharacterized protein YbjQ (UPF0145 family)
MQAWDASLKGGGLPSFVRERLSDVATGRKPWMSTMSPAELLLSRSHGLKPIATVSGVCWMHRGGPWTSGYTDAVHKALERLILEAQFCGANAVVDVEIRDPDRGHGDLEFSLIGTAVKMEGLPPSERAIVATTSALEFVRLLEADIVPVGVAVGAYSEVLTDRNRNLSGSWATPNQRLGALSDLMEEVRRTAYQRLREHAGEQGNGLLARTTTSSARTAKSWLNKTEGDSDNNTPDRYYAGYIALGTVVDTRRGAPVPHDIAPVVDMRDAFSPLLTGDGRRQRARNNESDI